MVNWLPNPRIPRAEALDVPLMPGCSAAMLATPGCSVARSVQERPFKGNSRTVVSLTVAVIEEDVSWTCGACAATSIVWLTWPTCNLMLNSCCAPTDERDARLHDLRKSRSAAGHFIGAWQKVGYRIQSRRVRSNSLDDACGNGLNLDGRVRNGRSRRIGHCAA